MKVGLGIRHRRIGMAGEYVAAPRPHTPAKRDDAQESAPFRDFLSYTRAIISTVGPHCSVGFLVPLKGHMPPRVTSYHLFALLALLVELFLAHTPFHLSG